MKKIILSFMLVMSVLYINAQCNLPYKTLSEFNKDTTAFIMYNFMDRSDCYKGKTLKDLLADLQIPIKDYFPSSCGMITSCGIYILIYV